jgi:hypothetical protein
VTSAGDAAHPDCLSMSKTNENFEKVKSTYPQNIKITICEVANMLETSSGSLESILKDR